MSRTSGLDVTTLTMWWNKLLTIVDEAQATLLRTAFSRIVTEAWDFSCALFDRRGEMIAQGRHGLPAFLGCMALALHDFLRDLAKNEIDAPALGIVSDRLVKAHFPLPPQDV